MNRLPPISPSSPYSRPPSPQYPYPGCPPLSPPPCTPCTPCPPYPPPYLQPDPSSPEAWDYGFQRLISFIQSPALIAGILGITVFLVITFASDAVLGAASVTTLGIAVTLATLSFLGIVVLLLFIL